MDRRIVIALCLVSSCTAAPSRLDEASRRNEAVAAAFGEGDRAGKAEDPRPEAPVVQLPPAPALSKHAVTLAPAPPGIDEALWREVGWFPADTTDIAESAALAVWGRDSIGGEFPECVPLFAGIERTYLVQSTQGARATNVLYGAMTRAQERACMQVALGALEVTGEQRGDMTVVSNKSGPAMRLAWFGRDAGTVVILEGDAPLEGWLRPVGTIADQPALIRLLAAVDRSQSWSVGLRDFGTAFTGVESIGYMMTMPNPASSGERSFEMTAQLEYATPKAAKQAERGAAAFARDVPGAAELGIVVSVRAEGNWLKSSITAELGKSDDEAITAWLQQVLAKVQAEVAKGG